MWPDLCDVGNKIVGTILRVNVPSEISSSDVAQPYPLFISYILTHRQTACMYIQVQVRFALKY
jgi:hypothetical protein